MRKEDSVGRSFLCVGGNRARSSELWLRSNHHVEGGDSCFLIVVGLIGLTGLIVGLIGFI